MYSGPFSILLVEDNPGDARLVQIALSEIEETRFTIRHVERLGQALDAIGGNAFDAVLLDLSLPDSHGLETVHQLKTAAPDIPIIVLSGLMDEDTAIEAVKCGAQDYLVKGQENATLISRAIRYAIERKNSEEALRRAHEQLEHRVAERTAELVDVNKQLLDEIAERKQSEAAQRKSERQLLLITDALPVLISYVDAEQRYQFNNKAYEDWFGIPREMVLGRTVREIAGDVAYEKIKDYILKALSGNEVCFELSIPFQYGGERFVNATYIPDKTEQGDTKGFFALTRDITEVKAAEEQQRQHLLQLAHVSRLSTTGEMATEIAHEINQPLTVIASYGDTCQRMLRSNNWEKEELLEALKQITQQAERASEVIRQLRSFVRKDESHRSTLDVNELAQEIVGLIDVEARWHEVDIELHLNQDGALVLANKILIQQVLLNLVRNAIEALADSGASVRQLSIQTTVDEDNSVVVAVRDTGPGLPADSLEQVFEAFHTTKADGMGMGLSISTSIISAHDGRLWCVNNEGAGSTFAFSLPIVSGEIESDAY